MLEKLYTLLSIIVMKILYKYFFKGTNYYISPWDTSPCLASLLCVLWNYLFIWSVPCNSQLQFSLAQIIMMLSICVSVVIFTFIILIQCWWWLFEWMVKVWEQIYGSSEMVHLRLTIKGWLHSKLNIFLLHLMLLIYSFNSTITRSTCFVDKSAI